ncbi:glycoside hydrolase family 38 C-terminal domain-containing protein [Georgenia deserti]|uniref:Glycoside hydrolase family 38 C-terminal domain-containing protein n=1 Tax=Georgenia deserti TaxID=2093781 RepID=A0ABW4L7Y5_9MICO
MTTALVKDHRWSLERARSELVHRAIAAESVIGGCGVQIVPEPLLRRSDDGRLLQAVRLVVDGPVRAEEILVRASGGSANHVQTMPGPSGSVRMLLPAVDTPASITVELPWLSTQRSLIFEQLPVRQWSIHLVQHSHYDIGYTDPQGRVLREQLAFLDSCLDYARATDGRSEAARFRWAVEALHPVGQWIASRPRAQVEEFFDRVRAGQIELTALPYNLHIDTCSTDELHELLQLSREVRQRSGVEMPVAMQTDVPGQPVGLPTALAQQGVRYLSVAHNWAGRSVPHMIGGQHLPRLFRWRAPSGESVLVWMTDTPHGLAYMEGASVGFSTSYAVVDELFPAYLTSLATHSHPYAPGAFGWHGPAVTDREPYPWDVLHLRVAGRYSDNAPPSLIHSDIVERWNETWEFPKLRLSTNADFFADAEQRVGNAIPTVTGDWGDWWVEGVGSAARPQAMVRQAQARVTDSETVSALGSVLGAHEVPGERERSRRTYAAISLFNEHTWGASNPWAINDDGESSGEEQWHWKYARALEARDTAERFLDDAVVHLGAGVQEAPDADITYLAVNTTGFSRSSVVSLFVRESRAPLNEPLVVRDARNGEVLPSIEIPQTNPNRRTGGRFLRVYVRHIPAAGSVQLTVARGPASDVPTPAVDATGVTVLENEHLRVEVDLHTSCIASILDKATGRELVDPDAVVGMNGYIYDTYTTAGGYNHQSNKMTVSAELELLGSRSLGKPAVLVDRSSNPLSEELTYEFAADGADWVRVRLCLSRHSGVLEIENRISKPATMTKESAFFAFPFAMAQPRTRFEITGGLTGPDLPEVPGAPRHMRAVREWVTFEEDDLAIAWATADAPLVHPEVVALPYAPFPESMSPRQPGTVYSWVHNNVWDTNFPVQQAFETSFRYAIGVRRAGERISSPGLAIRTAAELSHPVIGVLATGGRETVRPDSEWSLLTVEDDRVRLVAVEAVGPGSHLIKLQSFAEESIRARLRPGVAVSHATLATFLGDRLEPLVVSDTAIDVPVPALGAVGVVVDAA